ncbi:DNA-methyltransferase [Helicobacter bizzozeronii]|uniref:DNA-methyltransferase n=1 Tax=Helicobacter bizzozeronii TaxID=56877 RepID=UPI000CEEA5BE|nr:site-specific DNA-methyltransferase [Helicobacter bizzozeronii]
MPQPFFVYDDICLYQANTLNQRLLPPKSLDCTITSPPYNVGIAYNANADSQSYAEYLDFNATWLQNIYLWSKPSGRLCLNIPLDKNKGGQQSVGADIITLAKKIGWRYHSSIVWNEGNISRRTAWGSWLSPSAPYVIAPVELIVILYKEVWKKQHKGRSDLKKDEFMAWTNGLWQFNGESKRRIGHPAPFPRELPRRCIKLFSFIGDVICDPFSGSGTTMLEAYANQRAFVGIESDPAYCALAKQRFLKIWGERDGD